jgi:iron complex transport system permease protein
MHFSQGAIDPRYNRYLRQKTGFILVCLAALAILLIVSISMGAAGIPILDVLRALTGNSACSRHDIIIWNIRLPQALSAMVAGAGLSVSGAVMQSILRNPLGSPFTLGISHAAAFGAAFAVMVLDSGMMASSSADAVTVSHPWITTSTAFGFCIIAALAIVAISKIRGASSETMVLSGVALGALFTAGTMFLQFFADDVQLAAMVFWTFGDAARASWRELAIISGITLAATIYFILNTWNYNAVDAGRRNGQRAGGPGRPPALERNADCLPGHGCYRLISGHHRLCRSGVPPHGPAAHRRRQPVPDSRLSGPGKPAAAGLGYGGAAHPLPPPFAGLHSDRFHGSAGFYLSNYQRECNVMLDVDNISFRYNGHRVLDDISLMVDKGELLAVLGPNGVGKTTLLRCINAILTPSEGVVQVENRQVLSMNPMQIARHIGYVSQQQAPGRMTVFDTVLMGRRPHIRWSVSEQDLTIVDGALKSLNLQHLAMRYVDRISGGELQKVAIGRALVQEPRLLLLDEPTSSLDLKNQIDILSLVQRVAHEHAIGAVMTMHDLNMALRFADTCIFVKDGKIFEACRTREVTAETITSVYGVAVEIHHHNGDPVVIPVA